MSDPAPAKPYTVKPSGRIDPPPPEIEVQLRRLCRAIEWCNREIGAQKKEAEENRIVYVQPHENRVRVATEEKASLEATLLALLLERPEKARKWRHGDKLYYVSEGRPVVEIDDEEKALEELSKLGDEIKDTCIKIERSIKKKEVKDLLEVHRVGPFEFIRLGTGKPSLNVRGS